VADEVDGGRHCGVVQRGFGRGCCGRGNLLLRQWRSIQQNWQLECWGYYLIEAEDGYREYMYIEKNKFWEMTQVAE
jgi:hypothetical protein